MKIFTRNRRLNNTVIQLYKVITKDRQSLIDRPQFVKYVISLYEKFFGEIPKRFDIHGPYGVSKWKAVGYKAFMNKLNKRGYEDFYGISIYHDDKNYEFQFLDLKDSQGRRTECYQSLTIAYNKNVYSTNPIDIIKEIVNVFPIDYGYVTDLPLKYTASNESKPIFNIFGKSSMIDPIFWKWLLNISKVLQGEIKDVYRINLLNNMQVEKLNEKIDITIESFTGNILYLWTVDEKDRETIKEKLIDIIITKKY
jgi:hypothetical protein